MKAQLFILFLVIFIFSEPILADLAVDQGPSWSWGKLNQNRYAIYGDFDNNESVQWLILGDDSYKEGNYNEALERYEHALILTNRANNNEILPSVIENHIGDTFFKLGQYKNALQNYDEVQASIGDNDNENLKDQGAALLQVVLLSIWEWGHLSMKFSEGDYFLSKIIINFSSFIEFSLLLYAYFQA